MGVGLPLARIDEVFILRDEEVDQNPPDGAERGDLGKSAVNRVIGLDAGANVVAVIAADVVVAAAVVCSCLPRLLNRRNPTSSVSNELRKALDDAEPDSRSRVVDSRVLLRLNRCGNILLIEVMICSEGTRGRGRLASAAMRVELTGGRARAAVY
jgi:hypothetical protein